MKLSEFMALRFPLLTTLVLFLMHTVDGQSSIDSLPVPEIGQIETRIVDLFPADIEFELEGEDQTWSWELDEDFSYDVVFDTNDLPNVFPEAALRRDTADFSTYISLNDGGGYSIEGLFGVDPIGQGLQVTSFYTPAIKEFYAPVVVGDSVFQQTAVYTGVPLSVIPDSLLNELPIRPDSLRVRINIGYRDEISASGTLQINGSVAAENVLQLRRETTIAIGAEAQISILPWVDVTELLLEFADLLPDDVSLQDTNLVYYYLSAEAALPVAEVFVNRTEKSIMRIEYGMQETTGLFTAFTPNMPSQLSIYPNPAIDMISINIPAKTATIGLYDLQGRMVYQQVVSSDTDVVQFDLFDLPGGLFTVQTRSRNGVVTGAGRFVRH